MQTQEDKQEELHQKIHAFFELRGLAVQIKGNPWSPTLIIDNGLKLGCIVRGFYLIFIEKETQRELEAIKMNMNIKTYPTRDLYELIRKCDNTAGYRLRLSGTDLFVSGWQDRIGKLMLREVRYPLFAKFRPIVMPEETAITLSHLVEDYDIEVSKYSNPIFV
jgi:hypothetical protein